ncbi:hypothetical protein, partial [Methylobacterium sp. D54C]
HLNLAQLQHDLLRVRLLTSPHVRLLVLADPLNQPGPKPAGQVIAASLNAKAAIAAAIAVAAQSILLAMQTLPNPN